MIYLSFVIGAQPSGKAAVFDTAILGSNPSAPATTMLNTSFNFLNTIKRKLFPFYNNKELKFVFNKIQEDFPKETVTARFVGGCVRKYLTNEKIDDIDMATNLSPDKVINLLKINKIKFY